MKWNFKKSSVLVCVPGADLFLFAEVQDEKFIRYDFLPWDGDVNHLPDLFERAKAAGYEGNIALAAAFSDFRMAWEQLPEMTEEEVKETLYWNSDRTFPLEKEMVSDFQILSHTPGGYRLLVMGAGLDTVTSFAEAARSAGSWIAWVIPLPLLFEAEVPLVVGLAGRTSAGLYLWNGEKWTRDRRVEKASASETLGHVLKEAELENVVWIPDMTCGEAEYLWWTSILPGNEQPALKDWMLEIASKVPNGLQRLNLALHEDRPRPFFGRENRTLRILQGMTLGLGLTAVILGNQYLEARQERTYALQNAEILASSRAAMEAERKKKTDREAAEKERNQFLNHDIQWEPKLISLADGLPAGISLQSIEKVGDAIVIQGTADKSSSVTQLARQIRNGWQWDCRVESDKKDPKLPLRRFSLRCMEKKEAKP